VEKPHKIRQEATSGKRSEAGEACRTLNVLKNVLAEKCDAAAGMFLSAPQQQSVPVSTAMEKVSFTLLHRR